MLSRTKIEAYSFLPPLRMIVTKKRNRWATNYRRDKLATVPQIIKFLSIWAFEEFRIFRWRFFCSNALNRDGGLTPSPERDKAQLTTCFAFSHFSFHFYVITVDFVDFLFIISFRFFCSFLLLITIDFYSLLYCNVISQPPTN